MRLGGSSPSAVDEWRSNWTLVLAATIGFSFQSVMASGVGLFIEPLSKEFGWSRTEISWGLSIGSIISVLLSPLFGLLIDRWGTRRLALPGLALTAVATASFSVLNGSLVQWIALWVFWALASETAKSNVWSTAVAGVFTRSRGLALGVTLAGTALAQAVNPPLTNWLITDYGWRAAFFWIGTGWGGFALLLCCLFLYDIRDQQRLRLRRSEKIGNSTVEHTKPAAPLDLPGLSIPQAWRDPSLWRVAISTLIMMILTIALLVHQFPILTEAGVSRQNAAYLSSIGGLAGITGKILTGWLLDRYRANWVGGITIASTALAFGLLHDTIRTPALIGIAIAINGYSSGTKLQICGYLTTRYGGLRNFATIFGFMASVVALGAGFGPILGGLIYDSYGSYAPLLVLGVIGSLVSGWLIFGLAPYPDWNEKGPPHVPATGADSGVHARDLPFRKSAEASPQ